MTQSEGQWRQQAVGAAAAEGRGIETRRTGGAELAECSKRHPLGLLQAPRRKSRQTSPGPPWARSKTGPRLTDGLLPPGRASGHLDCRCSRSPQWRHAWSCTPESMKQRSLKSDGGRWETRRHNPSCASLSWRKMVAKYHAPFTGNDGCPR